MAQENISWWLILQIANKTNHGFQLNGARHCALVPVIWWYSVIISVYEDKMQYKNVKAM